MSIRIQIVEKTTQLPKYTHLIYTSDPAAVEAEIRVRKNISEEEELVLYQMEGWKNTYFIERPAMKHEEKYGHGISIGIDSITKGE